ncbi:MAG: septum site-determining protein MinC [Proteobacteria bacterium]|nr:septum site-determining protein MinC [Pseudomonadota bacterium]
MAACGNGWCVSLAAGGRNDSAEAVELKFGQVGIASVRVRRNDAAALHAELDRRVRAAPQLFERAAVVLDLSHLAAQPEDGEVDALLEAVRAAGMLPVGLAYGTSENDALARRLGLPLIAKFRAQYERAAEAPASSADTDPTASARPRLEAAPSKSPEAAAPVLPAGAPAQYHAQAVRTGQQVYARGRDLVVVAPVANGAEVLADGNVHVYGPLRGRAFAGALGDERARIFCSEFRAELVSIAGHYRVFEEIPAEHEGRPVQIYLDGGKLKLANL